ncbi:hypothetical protein ACQP2T_53580 [Nonomuraea sp. CA-143628]|uniref:hypothetical protein n=1 Tax=Nonomuraea sp. CA-143628 TaxID=3239997 RepID=UPI003D8A13A8
MTTATVTISQDQDSHQSSATQTLPPRDLTASLPRAAVSSESTTWGTPEEGRPVAEPSTWNTSVQQVRSLGVTGLDKWEGKILEIEGGTFTAELYPIDSDGMPITADFDLDLLGSDAATVVPGDVFYLSVRTVKTPGTRPTRTESLRLRRLGRITFEEVQTVYARADALMERLEQLFD